MTRADSGLVGTLLQQRYRVDNLLARGGMSVVHRGFDTRLERSVAIKIMDPRYSGDRSVVERFQREARAAAALYHPNVVAVHDQGVDETTTSDDEPRVFLVMELVTGGTLRAVLQSRGALDVHTALSVLEPVLAALSAAHEAGLAHRDIKPENILISAERATGSTSEADRVKVTDFGLARAAAGANTTDSGVILGTAAYLAPEQVTAGAAESPGDVYSAGVLLYEMLTGTVPYDGDSALSVAYRHVNDDVPTPSSARAGLPPALDTLVLRATRRDPRERPADAGRFLRELRELRDTLGIDAVPVPAPEPDEGPPTENIRDGAEHTVPAIRAVTAVMEGDERPPHHGTRTLQREQANAPGPEDPMPVDHGSGGLRGKRLIAGCVVLALLVGAGGLVWWFNARWITVPGVTGVSASQARETLRDAGFAADFTREPHDTITKSTVIGTDPAGGTDALPGDHITVRVSNGRPTVPDITQGMHPKQAAQRIRDAHLTPRRDSDADRYSTEVHKGTVLGTHPEPGTEANVDDPVTVILSNGPPPEPVPEVTGRTKKAAFEALRDKGFEPFVAGKEFATDVAEDRVVRTDPPADSRSGHDDSMRVGVYLSTAVKVPSVRGSSLDDATDTLRDAGLKVELDSALGGDEDDESRIALVVEQDPDPGERVASGSTIELRTVP